MLATTHEQAIYAARKVVVEYEELPLIMTIADAIAAESFYPEAHRELYDGPLDKEKRDADFHVSSTAQVGGQEHFYLEPNSAVVLPQDNGNIHD